MTKDNQSISTYFFNLAKSLITEFKEKGERTLNEEETFALAFASGAEVTFKHPISDRSIVNQSRINNKEFGRGEVEW